MSRTIAIVGGGFSGGVTAGQLLRRATGPLRVVLFDRRGTFGPGLAYSTPSDEHLLNVAAGRMSALEEDHEHFLRWLRGRLPTATAESFVPRRLYGEYVAEFLREAAKAARPGVRLELVGDDVVDIRAEGGGYELVTGKGERFSAGRVVLALGNPPPANVAIEDANFYGSERYIRDPWAAGAYRGIKPGDHLLLIGTALTMVDVALDFAARGHRAPIHAVSRHGLLPHLHGNPLASAWRGEAVGACETPTTARRLLRAVRAAVRAAEEEGRDWQSVIAALRPMTPRMWERLSTEERRRFLRHLRPVWDVHRHRLAPSASDKLYVMIGRRQLRINAGHLLSMREENGRVDVQVLPRGSRRPVVMHVDWVVNCTGPATDMRSLDSPLVKSLLGQGLMVADALALGVMTGGAGELIDREGRGSDGLFTLGALRRPQLWESTAVPELRKQARDLAVHLLDSLGEAEAEVVVVRGGLKNGSVASR